MKLIKNAIRTPDGTLLRSRHVHDFVQYVDKNGKTYMVDGGLSYLRRSANGDEVEASLYDDEPHEVQHSVLEWGSYGKEGDMPLHYIQIRDMETEHIQAVLERAHPSDVMRACMLIEIKERGET